jgi:hypothetical protein
MDLEHCLHWLHLERTHQVSLQERIQIRQRVVVPNHHGHADSKQTRESHVRTVVTMLIEDA